MRAEDVAARLLLAGGLAITTVNTLNHLDPAAALAKSVEAVTTPLRPAYLSYPETTIPYGNILMSEFDILSIVQPSSGDKLKLSAERLGYVPLMYSPRGERAAVVNQDNQFEIYDAAGHKIRTFNPTTFGHSYAGLDRSSWHPDGKTLLISSYINDITAFDTSTGLPRVLVEKSGYTYNYGPEVSPNGEVLVYSHTESGNRLTVGMIRGFDVNKKYIGEDRNNRLFNNQLVVVDSETDLHEPKLKYRFSADSSTFAFQYYKSLVLVDVASGTNKKFDLGTCNYTERSDNYDLSSDGSMVVIDCSGYQLDLIDTKTGNRRPLFSNFSGRVSMPKFSYGGGLVTFLRSGGDKNGVAYMKVDGSAPTTVPGTFQAQNFDWRPHQFDSVQRLHLPSSRQNS